MTACCKTMAGTMTAHELHYHLLTIKDGKTVKVQKFDTREEAIQEQARLNAKSPLRFAVPSKHCVGNCPEVEA